MPRTLHVPAQFITHTISHQEAAVRPPKLSNSRDMQYRKTNEFLPLISMETFIYPSKGLDRPLGLQEAEAPRISRQSAHEGGKAVSPTHRSPLSLGETRRIYFSLRLSLTFSHSQIKIPVTPPGIETATCRFMARCLNQLHHHLLFYLLFTFHNSYTEAQFIYILVRAISCSQSTTISASTQTHLLLQKYCPTF
jgi:hypothetical protein